MRFLRILISQFHKLYKVNGINDEIITIFQRLIYEYYNKFGRDFPFRQQINPYYVLVSEIMLQQTQTNRVSLKFLEFIKRFPDFESLARANNNEILETWQGLGYNRRAIALKKIANIIIQEYNGELPNSIDILKSFPQIGHNTASSILTFAYNRPTFFIETNIRRVYIYYFFPGRTEIDDKEILEILKKTIDAKNPREWYYALMDYGVMLKKNHPDLYKRSKHYKKQPKFKGSDREIRGQILKLLIKKKEFPIEEMIKKIGLSKIRVKKIIDQLEKEEFLKKVDNLIKLI